MKQCPLCQRILKPDPDYSDCFVCPTKITYPDCMPVPHYELAEDHHQWYVGPFKLEMDQSGISVYKVIKTDYPDKPIEQYIMFLEIQIPIDDSLKTVNKIKTLILFS